MLKCPKRTGLFRFALFLVLDCMMLSSVMTQNPISRKARWPGKRFGTVGAINDSKRFNPDPQVARTFADHPELLCFPY